MAIPLVIAPQDALANEVLCRAFNRRRNQLNVLACALNGKDLLKQVAEHQPDVAVISASLEDEPTAALQVLRGLRLAGSSTRAVVLLDCAESERAVEGFADGARGVFCASEGFEVLCKYDQAK
jgi:DNA-binding NarL/FixJ family response regulator